MAPSGECTQITITGNEVYANGTGYIGNTTYRIDSYTAPRPVKKETKKERVSRIATEKMLASRHVFDQKTMTVKNYKQICKPRHRLHH
jgi:hypothetical protein